MKIKKISQLPLVESILGLFFIGADTENGVSVKVNLKSVLDAIFDTKVDKVEGKGLSPEEYTLEEKEKLAGLEPYDDTEIRGRVSDIEAVIPAQAGPDNKLTDTNFVNSSIATNTAYFRGSFNVVDDLGLTHDATQAQVAQALAGAVGTKTNNDYVYVFFIDPDTGLTDRYDRYKYNSDTELWGYEYTLNNSSFTAAQWAAITSGATAVLMEKLRDLPTAEALAQMFAAKADKSAVDALVERVVALETLIAGITRSGANLTLPGTLTGTGFYQD